jgi:hypothetical protein
MPSGTSSLRCRACRNVFSASAVRPRTRSVFQSGFSPCLCRFSLHSCLVTFQEGNLVAQEREVGLAEGLTRFRHDLNLGQTDGIVFKKYREKLVDALAALRKLGISEGQVASLSVFTTQSATAVLEHIRDTIKAATPDPANFLLGSGRQSYGLFGQQHSIHRLAATNQGQPSRISGLHSPGTIDRSHAIHIAIHINVVYDVLPMTCGAVRALPCR